MSFAFTKSILTTSTAKHCKISNYTNHPKIRPSKVRCTMAVVNDFMQGCRCSRNKRVPSIQKRTHEMIAPLMKLRLLRLVEPPNTETIQTQQRGLDRFTIETATTPSGKCVSLVTVCRRDLSYISLYIHAAMEVKGRRCRIRPKRCNVRIVSMEQKSVAEKTRSFERGVDFDMDLAV